MRHIPNILSFMRILLIPLFIYAIYGGRTFEAALILGVSGLTDMFDGLLARRFGWVSQLGKVLDPVADKLTQVTVCIVFAFHLREYWVLFAIMLIKEVVMLILSAYLIKMGVKLEGAKWFGKVVTVLFYVSMTLILFVPTLPHGVKTALIGSTTACAIVAALLYIPDFMVHKRRIGQDAE